MFSNKSNLLPHQDKWQYSLTMLTCWASIWIIIFSSLNRNLACIKELIIALETLSFSLSFLPYPWPKCVLDWGFMNTLQEVSKISWFHRLTLGKNLYFHKRHVSYTFWLCDTCPLCHLLCSSSFLVTWPKLALQKGSKCDEANHLSKKNNVSWWSSLNGYCTGKN